jgi:DNA helicase-2/ATP-dependent DNA helicase PcrA
MLNDQQRQAVHTIQGRVLVLAGAGSGKTSVITHRIAHLIQSHNVSPHCILGLTFTNKAAHEMKERVIRLIGKELGKKVTLCTFHSFCMKVLRKEISLLGFTPNFSLYDERDLLRISSQIAKEMLGQNNNIPSIAPILSQFTKPENLKDPFALELFSKLQSSLRAFNAVSFDLLISHTIDLFEKFPEILNKYQDQSSYLMIDEYQDTNPSQFRLAELLSKKTNNLCVVGDDDQSIYGWRGADVKNILQFQADQTIKLEQNYRSSSHILDAANAVIQKNQNRHPKKLWTAASESHPIEVFHAPSEKEEAEAIATRILQYKEKGYKWSDMAILYRSNTLSRTLEMALLQASYQKQDQWVRGIPYEVFGGLEFSERSEIKDLLAYLRFIANQQDEEALLRIINTPRRGISDQFADEITQDQRAKQVALWTYLQELSKKVESNSKHPKGYKGLEAFVSLIEKSILKFSQTPPSEALTWLIEEINYKKVIEEEVKSDRMREFKWENVQECINALAQYEEDMRKEDKEKEISLQDFVSNTTLGKQSLGKSERKFQGDKLQLMTLHSAKGLEFPVVFIAGLEDHILPHEKGMKETSLEEERRLFYVGITRAKTHLCLSMARMRMRMGKNSPSAPSRFLYEIPNNLLNLTHYKFAI